MRRPIDFGYHFKALGTLGTFGFWALALVVPEVMGLLFICVFMGIILLSWHQKVTGKLLDNLFKQHVMPSAHLNTDESPLYTKIGKEFASHETVNHSAEEYARHNKKTGRTVTTNTVEGYFGNSKRSLDGTHHYVSGKHLPLYFAELDHKYNMRKASDGERTDEGIKRIEGKRLMLRLPLKKAGG
jgi:hypothetical protein